MTPAARCYAPAWVLVVWALLILSGVDAVATAAPGLLAEAGAIVLYLGAVRR